MRVNIKDLPKNTTILAYCRKLLKEGVDPCTKVEFYRDHDDPDVIINNLGEAVKWTVKESPSSHFVKYKEFSTKGIK